MKFKLLFFLSICGVSAQAQSWQWIQNLRTTTYVTPVIVDKSMNSYFINDSSSQTSISKRDSNGNILWRHDLYCSGTRSFQLFFDSLNNPYACCTFSGTISNDSFSLTSNGLTDILLLKISDTGISYIRKYGGAGAENGVCAFDRHGNMYITGGFTFSGTFDSYSFAGNSTSDFYLLKTDPSGNILWCHTDTDTSENLTGIDITLSRQENIFIRFSYTYSSEVRKYRPDGTFLIHYDIGAAYPYNLNVAWRVDSLENFYSAQYFTEHYSGIDYSFITKYDSIGNALWKDTLENSTGYRLTDLGIDPSGFFYFSAKADLIPGSEYIIGKGDLSNGFIYWTDNPVPGSNMINGVRIDSFNNIFIIGRFRNTMNCGGLVLSGATSGTWYGFIGKMGVAPATGLNQPPAENDLKIFPNPGTDVFHFSYKCGRIAALYLSVYNSNGQEVWNDQEVNVTGELRRCILLNGQPKGIYFLQVIGDGKKRSVKKIVLN